MRNLRGTYTYGFAPRDFRPRYHTLWKGCRVACAPCLGPTGAQCLDWTPYKNHGALTNFSGSTITLANAWVNDFGQYAIQHATGSPGTYLDLGRQQWIEGATIVSVSVWFRRPSVNALMLIGKGTAGDANNQFDVEVFSDGMVYFEPTSTAAGQGFGSFASNDTSWHHLAFLFNGNKSTNATKMRGFLDAQEQTINVVGTVGTAVSNPTGNLSIGRVQTAATRYSTALFDDYRIYDRVLSENEIKQLATARGISYASKWQEFATNAPMTLLLSIGMGVNASLQQQLLATVLGAVAMSGSSDLSASQVLALSEAVGVGCVGDITGAQLASLATAHSLLSDAQIEAAAALIVEKAIQLIVSGYSGHDLAVVQLVAQAMMSAAGISESQVSGGPGGTFVLPKLGTEYRVPPKDQKFNLGDHSSTFTLDPDYQS